MEHERGGSSRTMERPVTRWRRNQEGFGKVSDKVERPSTGIARPQSKYERPTSRRGVKDNLSEYNVSGSFRTATPGQNALAKPPSALILSNRVSTAGSRLTTMSSNTGLERINTGQVNMNVLDRPITQQGIAGVRPGTTRGLLMTRQIQDKRYYEGLLQLKIRELNQEIAVIMKDIDIQNKERATFLHYDKKAKDLAAELTTLQGELADYNIVVDKMNSGVDKETIEQEVRELAKINEHTMMEIEQMFEQRKRMEQKLHQLEKELQTEKKKTETIIETMDTQSRQKYDQLCKQKEELQEQANKMQQELDELSTEQAHLEEQIALSPLKQEAVKLLIKLKEAEEKRDTLREEQKTTLSPEEERENLLQKIKQDKMEIQAAEAQLAEKKKQISELEQQLEQLETDLEDTHSEKYVKYKELRKREEVMEQFMSTFEQNKKEELEKLENFETSIVQKLESISNGMEIDMYLTADEEIGILDKSSPDYEHNASRDQSFEGLSKEHAKLRQTLNKMEMLEERLKLEAAELNEKISKRESELIVLEDIDGLKARSEAEKEELIKEYEQLKLQQSECEQELKTVQEEYNELKERLDKNEIYIEISILETKLEKLKEESNKLEAFINEQKKRINYDPIKKNTFKSVNEYTMMLKKNLKSVY